jgi:O-antigen ligase
MDRLCGVGKFNDPNDLSMILVVCIITGGYFLTDSSVSRARRQTLIPVLGMLFYALYLTHSRGGMLSAVAALLVFLWTRMGGRNFVAVACLLLPMLLVIPWAMPGNVDLNNPEDTFQTRLELWSASLSQFRAAPVFGIGQGRIIDEIGQVTHNSYLHAYTEMGLLGGTAFLGISCLLLEGLWQASPEDRELARMRPYILAMIAGYSAGLLSLSRCYTAPTYLVFAVAIAYLAMASRDGPAVVPELDGRCIRRIFVLGTLFLGAIYLFLRVMLYRGVS